MIPSLALKQIGGVWSVRVGNSYRSVAYRQGNEFFWFWIGSRETYNKLLRRGLPLAVACVTRLYDAVIPSRPAGPAAPKSPSKVRASPEKAPQSEVDHHHY